LPRFYSKKLSGTLQQVVEEALEAAPAEQLELLEELAIMRTTTLDVLKLYEAALESGKQEMIVSAGLVVREAMKDVQAMTSAAFDMEQKRRDKVSAHNIVYVVHQIVRISAEVFGEDLDKAERFRRLCLEKLRVDDGKQGTTITPDQDVIDMDSTIPRAE